ncbi:MAG: AAA family ATPase [Oscillospiraceae bacterium]|nr:AAA family ATPase [Oscillospiraceae bacterium]
MGQILAVVSGKGGTGKTSLCAGIASCLAAEGCRVLCLDADIGLRNLDISLGLSELASLPFTELLRGVYDVSAIPEHPKIPGLFLLTAPLTETPESIDPGAFSAFLERLRGQFDYCLIDAPAGIGAGFQLACRDVDRVIVVSGSDPASLRDAASVSALLGRMPEGSVQLVVNRVVPKLFSRMGTTVDDLMDGVGLSLLGLVPEDQNVTLAAAADTPLILRTDKNAALACLHIARRLRGRAVPLMKLK